MEQKDIPNLRNYKNSSYKKKHKTNEHALTMRIIHAYI